MKKKLIESAKNEKYEDIVDGWMKKEYKSQLKKTLFAKFLVEAVIIPENVFQLENVNKLPFSKKIFAFFNKIRFKYLKDNG